MSENSTTTPAAHSVRTSDIVQEALRRLHDTLGLSFRSIARRTPYSDFDIPAGTLCTIYNTGVVPDKWRHAFGLPELKPAPVCKCGEVHTTKRCTANDRPRRKKDLYAYSVKELRWMMENRE